MADAIMVSIALISTDFSSKEFYLARERETWHTLTGTGRRLGAIMFTDIVGYTSLTQSNESLALRLLEKQRELIRPLLIRYEGQEIKTIGDAFLVEFASALQATDCAVEIQKIFHEYGETASEKVLLRIGIHVGDIIHSQGDVYGDAVNIASRIEPLAESGGVCISEQVYDQVRNKVPYNLVKIEAKGLKNVAVPIEVYKVEMLWAKAESVSGGIMDFEKNRIAVLPFANISPDPSDEYFADGMTEELTDRLSQVRGLKVIARTSVMPYKKKEKKVSEIGKELRAGTLVEGSVRKAGNKIRVTVQLIDVATEEHLWSSRYDKDLDDIFAVQSEIATRITETLPSRLIGERISGLVEGGTSNITAYSFFLQGRHLLGKETGDSFKQALDLFEKALSIDPSFARAYTSIAKCYILLVYEGLISSDDGVTQAKREAEKALSLEKNLPEVHSVLSEIALLEDDDVRAEAEAKRAIELNPNLAQAYMMLAAVKSGNGFPKEGIRLFEAAYQLDPLSPEIISNLGAMYHWTGREKEAEDHWNRNLRFAPASVMSGVASYQLDKGEYEKAEKTIETRERDFPNEINTIYLRGILAALRGERKVAEKTIMKLEERFKGDASLNLVAFIRYFLGDLDAFFAGMFLSVENHALPVLDLRYAPSFEKARHDPRYREVLIKNGLDPDNKE